MNQGEEQSGGQAARCGAGHDGGCPDGQDERGVDRFRELIRLLERRGRSATRIEKIMGRNLLDHAERVWTA